MNQKELFFISVTIFFTVIVWIIADLYHVSTTQKVTVKDKRFLKEINITLNKEALQKLQFKQ